MVKTAASGSPPASVNTGPVTGMNSSAAAYGIALPPSRTSPSLFTAGRARSLSTSSRRRFLASSVGEGVVAGAAAAGVVEVSVIGLFCFD